MRNSQILHVFFTVKTDVATTVTSTTATTTTTTSVSTMAMTSSTIPTLATTTTSFSITSSSITSPALSALEKFAKSPIQETGGKYKKTFVTYFLKELSPSCLEYGEKHSNFLVN
jgi:regulator of PEP synthase PpsR (kinase-PPPase family)